MQTRALGDTRDLAICTGNGPPAVASEERSLERRFPSSAGSVWLRRGDLDPLVYLQPAEIGQAVA